MLKNFLKSHSFVFLVCVILGFTVSYTYQLVTSTPLQYDWSLFSYILLGLGLYGGVYGIDLGEFRNHKKLILSAVTLGVILKSLIIGGSLFIITWNPLSFILGVIVAQIDPISVGHLLKAGKSKRLSPQGETILRAWSSFDDPMTVLLALYLALPLTLIFQTHGNIHFQFGEYFLQLVGNFLFAGIIYIFYKITKNSFKNHAGIDIVILFMAFIFAVYFQYMLAIAIIALFLRPQIDTLLDRSVQFAFIASSILVGLFITTWLSLYVGIILGVLCIISQIISSFLIAKNLEKRDKIYLGLGQQNGITSIILTIILFPYFPGIAGIIVPAILTINIGHYINNYLADQYLNIK